MARRLARPAPTQRRPTGRRLTRVSETSNDYARLPLRCVHRFPLSEDFICPSRFMHSLSVHARTGVTPTIAPRSAIHWTQNQQIVVMVGVQKSTPTLDTLMSEPPMTGDYSCSSHCCALSGECAPNGRCSQSTSEREHAALKSCQRPQLNYVNSVARRVPALTVPR